MLRVSEVFVSASLLVCLSYLQHQSKRWKRFLIDWFMMGTLNGFTGVRGEEEARCQDQNMAVGHPAAQSVSDEASANVTLHFCPGTFDL